MAGRQLLPSVRPQVGRDPGQGPHEIDGLTELFSHRRGSTLGAWSLPLRWLTVPVGRRALAVAERSFPRRVVTDGVPVVAAPAAAMHARAPGGAGARAGRRLGPPGPGPLPRRRLILRHAGMALHLGAGAQSWCPIYSFFGPGWL